MPAPLVNDIRSDRRFGCNFLRVLLFIAILFVFDLFISLVLLKGIERFYGLGSDADVLMIGHSHLMLAVDKVALEEESGLRVARYTREGVNMADRRVMAQQYFDICSGPPETVILSIDPWLFSGEGLSLNSWKLFLPFMDDKGVNYYVKSSAKKFDYYRYKVVRSGRFNAQLLNASARGWLRNWDNLKFGVVDTVRYNNEEALRGFRPITFSRELMDDFSATLDFLGSKNTRVLLLNTPVWEPLIAAQRVEYDRSMFLIDSIAWVHCPGAEIIDLVQEFAHRTELFFDPIHMNPEGQRVVTKAVSEFLRQELDQSPPSPGSKSRI
ncbi:MAG: hypothetical protein RQ737_13880 [Bacteroidales bacterium]|nr:hypothetical protein [Bacteroidales bacterium]